MVTATGSQRHSHAVEWFAALDRPAAGETLPAPVPCRPGARTCISRKDRRRAMPAATGTAQSPAVCSARSMSSNSCCRGIAAIM